MERITIKEALSIIDTGKTVSLSYVSYDKKRKTGGDLKFLPEVIVTNPKENSGAVQLNPNSERSPNNFDNSTRNFYTCINGKPTSSLRKIHVFLILEIDGKKVML